MRFENGEVWFKPWESKTIGGLVLAIQGLVASSILLDWPMETSEWSDWRRVGAVLTQVPILLVAVPLVMGNYDEKKK